MACSCSAIPGALQAPSPDTYNAANSLWLIDRLHKTHSQTNNVAKGNGLSPDMPIPHWLLPSSVAGIHAIADTEFK